MSICLNDGKEAQRCIIGSHIHERPQGAILNNIVARGAIGQTTLPADSKPKVPRNSERITRSLIPDAKVQANSKLLQSLSSLDRATQLSDAASGSVHNRELRLGSSFAAACPDNPGMHTGEVCM